MGFDVVPMQNGKSIDLGLIMNSSDERIIKFNEYLEQLGLEQQGGYEIEITNGDDVTRLDEAGKHIFGSGFELQCNLIIPTEKYTEMIEVTDQKQFINLVDSFKK